MRNLRMFSAVFLVAACAGEANQPVDAPQEFPGIQALESSVPKWERDQGWRIAEAPLLDLANSGTGPSHEFERVSDALRLEDGRIVVADDGWREVRLFSPSGDYIRSMGNPGEGPGEFRRIRSISRWRGDSLVAFDQMLGRATIFSESGGVRTILLGSSSRRPVYVHGLGESGLIGLFSDPGLRPTDPGAYRRPYFVLQLDAEGVVVDTLAEIGGREEYLASGVSGPLVIGKDGQLAARGFDVVFGGSGTLAFERYRDGVGQVQEVRALGSDLALSDEEIEQVRRLLIRPHDPPDIRRFVETMPIPSSRPAFSKLLIDAEGCVWAASYRIPSEPEEGARPWEVFDAEGAWLGQVMVPDGFSPLDIGGKSILGVWRDSLDVQHVQIRALTRTR